MKRSDLKQLIKETINEEIELPHAYAQSTKDIASNIVAKAARMRNEYHVSYKDALRSILKYVEYEASKLSEPKEGFPV